MAINELSTVSQVGSWRVPQFPAAIEYPLELMEEIRAFACDELLQLSHAGNEVGGVLFGTRRDDLIQIVTWRPIACEHGEGESLSLSFNDRMNLAVQLELARQNADLKDLRPLGCFLSHLRDGVCLRASDLEIYNGFFPASWQVALVICPKGKGHAEAGFFVREAGEKLQSETSYRCFELQPLHPENLGKSEGEPAPGVAARKPAPEVHTLRSGLPLGLRPGAPASATAAAPAPAAEGSPAPDISPLDVALPSFQTEERIPAKERWMWAIPILLALGIAGFVLYQQRTPAGSGIGLRVSDQDQTVQITWDARLRAVRDAYRGEIAVDDGGKQSQIALSSEQLHSGKMSYLAQSGDIGFEMTIYPANGEPIHDSTRLVGAVSHAATQPPQLLPETAPAANPAPATPVPTSTAAVTPAPASSAPPSPNPATTNSAVPPLADQSALEKQVQELKQQVAKERARADELQNLVRILENRLAIQSPGSKPEQGH